MSKNHYSDMIALVEWASRQKKEKKYTKKEFTFKDYMKFKKELEEFEKWEKSMIKKDVKQEEKKHGPSMSAPLIAMILVGSFPIIAPLYVMWLRTMFP